jgi:hypothetical protein
MIADELQIGKTFVYSILMEDLEMRKICVKIVPKQLTPEQKLQKIQCCIDWKVVEERDAFKLVLHGGHLGDVATITAELTMLLEGVKEDDFQGCFNQWKWRWDKCIASEGEYFEGDKNYIPDNA